MKIATIGSGPRLDVVRYLLTQNKIDFLKCDVSAKGLTNAKKLKDSFLIFLSIPANDIRRCCDILAPHVGGRHAIVHTIHTLEKDTHKAISTILEEELSTQRFGFLTGPMRLEDVKKKRPCSALCATDLNEIQEVVSQCLAAPNFRVYQSSDMAGAEIAAIYSRVISFCVGIAYDLGDPVQSILFARGLAEASRLIASLKGDMRTPFGLSGLANLHLSLAGKGSADFQLGREMTKKKKKTISASRAHHDDFKELVSTLKRASDDVGLESSILNAAQALVLGMMSPEDAMKALMSLPSLSDF